VPARDYCVRVRLRHVAGDDDLIRANATHVDGELRSRARPAPNAGVRSRESRVELIFELAFRQIRDLHLTDVRNDDKSLACDLEVVRRLHVAGENQHEPVAWPKPVVLVDRTGDRCVELRRL
jgi:hypothetical protein